MEVYACPAVVACASPNISLSAATTGCAAANRSLADLVSVGGGGRAAAVAVAWTGTGAQVPVTGSALSFTFVPGAGAGACPGWGAAGARSQGGLARG